MSNQHGKVACAECQVVTGYKNFARHMKRKHPIVQAKSKHLSTVLPQIAKKNDTNDDSSTLSRQSLWCDKKAFKGTGNRSGTGLLYSTNATRPRTNFLDRPSENLQYKSVDNDTKLHIKNVPFGGVKTVRSPSVTKTDMTNYVWKTDDKVDDSSTSDNGNIRIHKSSRDANYKDDGKESGSDDENAVEDFNLWEQFVQVTLESKGSIFDTITYFLSPYILRSEDETYKEIMYDVEEALHCQNMTYVDALNYALEKNKDLILSSVDYALKNDCGDDDPFTIWHALADLKMRNKECHWLSYSPCYCNNCCGACMITQLQYMLIMFHHMATDDVIHDIMLSIRKIMEGDDEVVLWNVAEIAVKKHRSTVLEKVREVEKRILGRFTVKKEDEEDVDVDEESMGNGMDPSTDEDSLDDDDSFNPFRVSCLYKVMKRDAENEEKKKKNFSGCGMYLNPWRYK